MNFLELSRYFKKLEKDIPKAADAYRREVASSIFEYLAVRTPVDTGAAVSNWKVTPNETFSDFLPPYVEGSRGDTRSVNVDFAIGLATNQLSQSFVGKKLLIINNAPYIGRLNEGWSKQAPSKFIESSIVAGLDRNFKFKV